MAIAEENMASVIPNYDYIPNYEIEFKEAIKEAIMQLHSLILAWINQNVPRHTGELISSAQVMDYMEGEVFRISVGFSAPHAIFAETMTNRNRFPRDSNRISPFMSPLQDYIKAKWKELLIRQLNLRRIKTIGTFEVF